MLFQITIIRPSPALCPTARCNLEVSSSGFARITLTDDRARHPRHAVAARFVEAIGVEQLADDFDLRSRVCL